jgi:hypothetical protein
MKRFEAEKMSASLCTSMLNKVQAFLGQYTINAVLSQLPFPGYHWAKPVNRNC